MPPENPTHQPTVRLGPPQSADATRTYSAPGPTLPSGFGPPITGPVDTWPTGLTRYKPLHLLGDGGMGEVYLAHDTQLDRQVAIKFPRFGRRPRAEIAAHVLQEARAAARLHHPGICPVFDADVCDGVPYLTMAFVQGPTLAAELKRLGPCPPAYAARLVRAVAEAMQYAHDHGVIHRDLKPANILLTPAHEPVVTDFGLAVRLDREELAHGVISGTPHYMAPEQAAGDAAKIGERTDVYALGVILFQMLTGRVPFDGPPVAVLAQVKAGGVPPVRGVRPQVPRRLARIVAKATSRDPADRYPGMTAFADALADFLRRELAPKPKWRAWLFWLAAIPAAATLTLCVLCAGVGLMLPAWFKQGGTTGRGEAPSDDPGALVAEGRDLERSGKPEQALVKYTRALELAPDDRAARERRGELALRLEKWDTAAADFTVLRRVDPGRADYHSGWGEAVYWKEWAATGSVGGPVLAKSLDAAEVAIYLDPNHARGHLLRAEVHIEQKEYEAAEKDATAAIELEPDKPEHWRMRVQARSLLGKDAEGDIRRAEELERKQAERPAHPPPPGK